MEEFNVENTAVYELIFTTYLKFENIFLLVTYHSQCIIRGDF